MEATKKQTKRDTTIQFFTLKSESVENYKDQILIFRYYDTNGKPCAAILLKKEIKPSYHYRFEDEAQRNDFIERRMTSADNDIFRQNEQLRKNMLEAEKYCVGAILYSSWGYDQTNIDFYIILERVNNTVTLQQIGGIRQYDHSDSGKVSPDASKTFGEPFKKRINQYGVIKLTSYSYCNLYDGTPKYFSTYA